MLDCVRGNNTVFNLFLPVIILGPIEDNDGDYPAAGFVHFQLL